MVVKSHSMILGILQQSSFPYWNCSHLTRTEVSKRPISNPLAQALVACRNFRDSASRRVVI